MQKSKTDSVLIVAGEASSALYARRLLELYQEKQIYHHFFGVGDYSMEKMGFERLGQSEKMAVVGFQEVIKHYSDLKTVYDSVVDRCRENPPKYAVLLDYPGFNLKLAKDLKSMGIPVIYYISPQLWAWKKGRIKLVQKYVDLMLVLFPFEKEFYKEHHVNVEFVGHPLLDELSSNFYDQSYIEDMRGRFGVHRNEVLVGLLPGSRQSELDYNLTTQLQSAVLLHQARENIKIALLVAPGLEIDQIKERMPEDLGIPLIFMQDDPMKMVSLIDIALCASGTATVLVGLLKKPMAIMYKMNPFTAWLAKLLVRGIKHFGMVNLICEKEVCKEFFQREASAKNLSDEVLKLIDNKPYFDDQVKDLERLKNLLGDHGATQRVFDALMRFE
ncbi:MAG: lipid-A-disaccharide synthase [Bdellovibrionales bacterium]|nr:lipid-A-disaccharide synthase [Bdellovibrionales bacterium]